MNQYEPEVNEMDISEETIANNNVTFKPEEYEFITELPDQEKLHFTCHKCQQEHGIFNPAWNLEDENVKPIDVAIYRQGGFLYRIASLIALVPAFFIAGATDNWPARIILLLLVGIPLYRLISEGLMRLFGKLHQVAYVICDVCHENIFIAFNGSGTKVLQKISL